MMTWGEIRREVQEFAPGLSMRRLTSLIQQSYETLLGLFDWQDIEFSAGLDTVAEQTGTAALTNGSATVTGVATSWTSGLDGRKFRFGGESEIYTGTFVSAGVAQLDRPYTGSTASAVSYRLFENVYTVVAEADEVIRITRLERKPKGWLDQFMSRRPAHGTPFAWEPSEISDPTVDPVLRAVELYSIPTKAERFTYTYKLRPVPFDGSNTDQKPVSFVPSQAIIAAVKAQVCVELPDYRDLAAAQMLMASAKDAVQAAIAREARRRGPSPLRMDTRFTSHNRNRLLSYAGLGEQWDDDSDS